MRDNNWLKNRFNYIYQQYFCDVEIINNIIIRFGRPTKTRLGSIKQSSKNKKSNSIITINGHFRDPDIPSYVIDAVIAHELTHYTHGFCSPYKQTYCKPHQGGIVDHDLKKRGLADILRSEKYWIKNNWNQYIDQKHPYKNRKRKNTNIFKIIWR
jgi:hypothetical protein